MFTETWLRSSIFDSEILCNDYAVFRRDRPDGYGGVLVAVRSELRCQRVFSPLFEELDFIALKIQLHGIAIYITCSYIPPRSDDATYARHCQSILFLFNALGPTDGLVVCGDFNIPNARWEVEDNAWSTALMSVGACSLLDSLIEIGLNQINKVRNSIGRLLDLVLVNNNFTSLVSRAAPMSFPEDMYHPPLSFSVETLLYVPKSTNAKQVYRYKDTDFMRLRDMLNSINWSNLFQNKIMDTAVMLFYEVVWSCINICVPVATVKTTTAHPWITPQLKFWKNRKNRFYKKYKRTGILMHYAQYIEARHRYIECNRNSYFAYINKIKAEIRLNPKRFFNFVNTKRKSNGYPAYMSFNENTASSDTDIANMFAEYFESVYSDNSSVQVSAPPQSSAASPTVAMAPIDVETVRGYLKTVKPSCQPGPDNVPSIIVKQCADVLCSPLAFLFNLSLDSGVFPAIWKDSFIIPLHKSGIKSHANNYRGIAKLSCIPKVFEHIVTDSITPLVSPIISPQQHGFMKGRSTVTNLLEFSSYVHDGFSKGKQTDVIFTDFTKAFDRLCIPLLLHKLDVVGFSPKLLRWIESYLSNRSQRVLYNGNISREIRVSSGVPQGSHLGPLLFNIYINDLPLAIQNCRLFMFADDVKICYSYTAGLEPSLIQPDLDNFERWCESNCLRLNIAKCKHMSLSWRQTSRQHYKLHNTSLETVTEFRDLGILVDSKLRFNLHIQHIVNKSKSLLGFMKRWSKEFMDPYITKLLFTSIVRPTLEYASPVWNPHYSAYSDMIESVQKQFLLFALSHFNWNPHMNLPPYEARLKLIRLPTLHSRRTTANVLFLHKLLSGDIDCPTLLNRISINVPVNPERLQRTQRRYIPVYLNTCLTNYADNEPFRSICKDYNNLYELVCFSKSFNEIRSQVTRYLNT